MNNAIWRGPIWRGATGLAGALALAGCFSFPKPEPFEMTVAGGQLRAVGGAEAVGVAAMAAPPAVEAAEAAVSVLVAETPAAAPERTDIRGAGDGSMKVDDDTANRVVVRAKSTPHRAPNFSSEQAAAMTCAAVRAGFGGENVRRMHEATLAAERARAASDSGAGTYEAWEKAELKRQDAVNSYMMPVPLLGLFVSTTEKKESLPEAAYKGARIENTDLFTFKENGREVIAVSGVVRNTGAVAIELPPITLRAIDQWNFVIAGQTALLPFETLAPGEARPFETRFLNPPTYTDEVYVHFAPPFAYRSPRDCEFFDPSKFDETASLAETKPAQRASFFADPLPTVSTSTGPYSAGELNELMLYFRRESEAAWRCANEAQDTCVGAQRLHWRDMFVLSEALDEAWVALRAAEGKGSAEDVATGAAARDRTINRVRTLAEKALARAGAQARDIDVKIATSTYGRDETGLFVEIAGTVHNSSAEARRVDALMIAFVDRLELPLSSLAIDVGIELAPGQSKPFTQRIAAGRGGRQRNYAPGRIPPREIPWEVRVGAMARE